jgi:hypothetical protein
MAEPEKQGMLEFFFLNSNLTFQDLTQELKLYTFEVHGKVISIGLLSQFKK